uniref:Uncharacterized protein n=1 Tax=Lactuca sativa TaxID=4236 RepID=A0A9R1X5R5_LACSA|nr:hypothetical protein LSAT_V11C600332470 [Lactuca sativa]
MFSLILIIGTLVRVSTNIYARDIHYVYFRKKKFARLSHDAREVLMNIVLSLNQHNVSIITLIEGIREYMQQTFVERSLMAGSLNTVLTPYAEMVLHKRMQKSIGWKATQIPQHISSPFPQYIYLVFNFKTTCIVDLNGHTCSCGK